MVNSGWQHKSGLKNNIDDNAIKIFQSDEIFPKIKDYLLCWTKRRLKQLTNMQSTKPQKELFINNLMIKHDFN